jgi:subtilisin family serine protease
MRGGPRRRRDARRRGLNIEVAWPGGRVIRSTGNSFATPHVSAIAALVLSKHPGLTPFQLKTVLSLVADNVERAGTRTDLRTPRG